ncbi:hypothetical protein BO78DRAFT_88966 [Aspergillus sclerotiicarbonarius CBS 121057]|uniref:Uncharacterized protein n=1 Tax=Aspergillus sclerotiicarbonarius (strain CBS 121057 / IBT 28362) TaxID=1448318 RepID=A0A319EIC4_ASPSB|nr:hypothetical protein BO78DRAFT_88966 [Aspergillus sclerotiicarbonarius CBS 121057]
MDPGFSFRSGRGFFLWELDAGSTMESNLAVQQRYGGGPLGRVGRSETLSGPLPLFFFFFFFLSLTTLNGKHPFFFFFCLSLPF